MTDKVNDSMDPLSTPVDAHHKLSLLVFHRISKKLAAQNLFVRGDYKVKF